MCLNTAAGSGIGQAGADGRIAADGDAGRTGFSRIVGQGFNGDIVGGSEISPCTDIGIQLCRRLGRGIRTRGAEQHAAARSGGLGIGALCDFRSGGTVVVVGAQAYPQTGRHHAATDKSGDFGGNGRIGQGDADTDPAGGNTHRIGFRHRLGKGGNRYIAGNMDCVVPRIGQYRRRHMGIGIGAGAVEHAAGNGNGLGLGVAFRIGGDIQISRLGDCAVHVRFRRTAHRGIRQAGSHGAAQGHGNPFGSRIGDIVGQGGDLNIPTRIERCR